MRVVKVILLDHILPNELSRDDGVDFVAASIAPRAIIMMLFPLFTPLSVYAVNSMGQPLLLLSEKAEKYFLPWMMSWATAEKLVHDDKMTSLKSMFAEYHDGKF